MAPPPLPLRAHMTLCLLGFRGKGYDEAFIAAMAATQSRLQGDGTQPVTLIAEPDPLCHACPNLAPASPARPSGGCTLGGPAHEAHMREHDLAVLNRLDLEEGTTMAWEHVLAQVARRIRGTDLPGICTTCPWLPLGVCAEAVDALRTGAPPPPAREASPGPEAT